MAGLYPDVPGLRLAWDRDSSVGFSLNGFGSLVAMNAADRIALNNEAYDPIQFGLGGFDVGIGVIFPSPRTLVGAFVGWQSTSAGHWHEHWSYSNDTTNGLDGTWIDALDIFTGTEPLLINPQYRTEIKTWSPVSAKAFRYYLTSPGTVGLIGEPNWYVMHIYGSETTPTKLHIWDPVVDAEVGGAYFDWGDCAAPSNATLPFRVKNCDPTLTASNPAIAMEALTDGVPSIVSMHQFSLDNVDYSPSIVLPDIPPNSISDVVYIRRVTILGAPAGLWDQRIIAAASFV